MNTDAVQLRKRLNTQIRRSCIQFGYHDDDGMLGIVRLMVDFLFCKRREFLVSGIQIKKSHIFVVISTWKLLHKNSCIVRLYRKGLKLRITHGLFRGMSQLDAVKIDVGVGIKTYVRFVLLLKPSKCLFSSTWCIFRDMILWKTFKCSFLEIFAYFPSTLVWRYEKIWFQTM